MQITCLFCENEFDVVPRDPLWKGRLRRTLICTKCSQEFKLRDVLQGARSNKPQVALLTKQGGVTLFLQDYDCSSEQAQTFASGFDEAWKKLPQIARTEIEMHWSSDPLLPLHRFVLAHGREHDAIAQGEAAQLEGRKEDGLAHGRLRKIEGGIIRDRCRSPAGRPDHSSPDR